MKTASKLPMWSVPSMPSGFPGAALADSTSEIQLTSRLPNIFGTDGDYVEFNIYCTSWVTDQVVFGSTVSPDVIYMDDTTIYVFDGDTTVSVNFDSTLSTNTWYQIRLYREQVLGESLLLCNVDSELQVDTGTPLPVDIDVIFKNNNAFTDVRCAKLSGFDGDYFYKASPSSAVLGSTSGFWRSGWFYLESYGNHCIEDCLVGFTGWRIEVENVYLSSHRLVFTAGNGVTTVRKESEIFSEKTWVHFYVDLEDLGVTPPDPGDVIIEDFVQSTGDFYLGAYSDQSVVFDGLLDSIFGGDGNLTSAQVTWLENDGLGRAVDEIGAGTTVSTSDIAFGWGLEETSGVRYDAFGTDNLTPIPGTPISDGFEAVTDNWFDGWGKTEAGATTVSVDSLNPRTGTYCGRIDMDAAASDGALLNYLIANLTNGKTYTFSVYVACTATGMGYRILYDNSGNAVSGVTTDTAYTEITFEFTSFGSTLRLTGTTGVSESLYFDDLTITANNILSAVGLRSTFTFARQFSGYLYDVKMNADAGYIYLPLDVDANDDGGDSNNGTATNVTFVAVDPGA